MFAGASPDSTIAIRLVVGNKGALALPSASPRSASNYRTSANGQIGEAIGRDWIWKPRPATPLLLGQIAVARSLLLLEQFSPLPNLDLSQRQKTLGCQSSPKFNFHSFATIWLALYLG